MYNKAPHLRNHIFISKNVSSNCGTCHALRLNFLKFLILLLSLWKIVYSKIGLVIGKLAIFSHMCILSVILCKIFELCEKYYFRENGSR